MRYRRAGLSLLYVSAALGPIYWLPLISIPTMYAIKIGVGAALSIWLLLLRKRIQLSYRLLFISLIILLVSLLSSLIKNDIFFLEIAPIVIFLLFGNLLAQAIELDDFLEAISAAGVIFSMFASIIVIDLILGGWFPNPYYTQYIVYVYESGLTGGRTAWAYASNLFLAINLQGSLYYLAKNKRKAIFLLFCAAIVATNILVVGARGGAVVAIFIILVFLAMLTRRKNSKLLISVLTALFFLSGAIFLVGFSDELRIITTLMQAGTRNLSTLDSRFTSFSEGWMSFSSSPFFGTGSIFIDIGSAQAQIHNVWLRFIVERGVLFALPIIFTSLLIFRLSYLGARSRHYQMLLLLSAGILTGLFEPKAIFGNYFASQIFWITAAFFLARGTAEARPGNGTLVSSCSR
ncbi:O-antigen ligase family protein [Paracoccaceae bacterium Fryx2]|nr:O-antigen ligase family protein [Paracoccaceae bacterium Fryx2]